MGGDGGKDREEDAVMANLANKWWWLRHGCSDGSGNKQEAGGCGYGDKGDEVVANASRSKPWR